MFVEVRLFLCVDSEDSLYLSRSIFGAQLISVIVLVLVSALAYVFFVLASLFVLLAFGVVPRLSRPLFFVLAISI